MQAIARVNRWRARLRDEPVGLVVDLAPKRLVDETPSETSWNVMRDHKCNNP